MKLKKILKIIIIICGSVGSGLTLFSGGYNLDTLLYFTILSNIAVVFITSMFLYMDDSNKEIKMVWHILRYMIAAAITLTFIVFNATLMPEMIKNGDGLDLLKMSNLLNHNITPVLFVVDFVLFGKLIPLNKIYYTLFMPLGYFIITLMMNPIFGVTYGSNNEIVPYFFLNYQKNGWFSLSGGFFGIGVFYWVIIVLVIVLLIGYGLFLLRNLNKKEFYIVDVTT